MLGHDIISDTDPRQRRTVYAPDGGIIARGNFLAYGTRIASNGLQILLSQR